MRQEALFDVTPKPKPVKPAKLKLVLGRPKRNKDGLTDVQVRLIEKKRKYDEKRYASLSKRAKWGSAEHREKLSRYGFHKRKKAGHSAITRLFTNYQYNAKVKGVPFQLSREEFCILIASPCHYCGAPPAARMWHKDLWSGIIYNGVDRVNNGFGYEEGNAVPCCRTCNVAKRDMAVEDFLAWIKRAYLHQTENRP